MDGKGVLEFLKEKEINWVDLQFTDLIGSLQHITIPSRDFDSESFESGFGKLDGSSIKGFTSIHESDMILKPVPSTLTTVPWGKNMGRILCNVFVGAGQGRFERDPRSIAEMAEAHASKLGYKPFFGPEPEFFIFDSVDVNASNPHGGTGYTIHAREAPWEGKSGSIKFKEGYYPAPPKDQLMEIRHEIVETLTNTFGFRIEAHHHEVATAGQCEIDFRFSTLVDTADKLQTLKYVVKNIASQHGLAATFMPKPMYGDNGTGMHTHFSLWDADGKKNLMYDPSDSYAEVSQTARYAIGGILAHARALSAIVSPTANSYRRLIPGFEAPVYLAWSKANRSAIIRVPSYYKGKEETKRIEYRAPDPTSNPYLTFSALLCAALDGIAKKTDPGDPLEENIFHLSPQKKRELNIGELPRSLDEALDELEGDHNFLRPIFNQSIVDTFIDLKREETKNLAMYPHPMELYYYFDS
jgi:glutamine synthetase